MKIARVFPRKTKATPKVIFMRIIIGEHARQRFYTRGGTGKLSTARVKRSLRHTLRMGAAYTNEAVRTQIDHHLDAVCVPLSGAEGGGWLCATIVPRQEDEKNAS